MTTAKTPPPKPRHPPIETPPGLQVEYANLVRIAHSPSEIVFEFAQLLPGNPSAQVQSRIIMSPLGAKLFAQAIKENLAKYESLFGEITIPGGTSLADHLFRTPEKPPEK